MELGPIFPNLRNLKSKASMFSASEDAINRVPTE